MQKFPTNHYYDKHGKEIKAGMTIQHDNGSTEEVFAVVDQYFNDDLGVLASNPDYLKRHPDAEIEYYSLRSFNTSKEWEIVQ